MKDGDRRRRPNSVRLSQVVRDTAVMSAQPIVRVDLIIDHFLSRIAVELAKGRQVQIHNWGTFKPRNAPVRKNQPGALPLTIAFKAQLRLRKYINTPYVAPKDRDDD